jgi:hypothetical protein
MDEASGARPQPEASAASEASSRRNLAGRRMLLSGAVLRLGAIVEWAGKGVNAVLQRGGERRAASGPAGRLDGRVRGAIMRVEGGRMRDGLCW